MSHSRDAVLYLKQYPEIKKWVRQCIVCQEIGYDPDMPDEVMYSGNVRALFTPLKLNDIGICDQCENHV